MCVYGWICVIMIDVTDCFPAKICHESFWIWKRLNLGFYSPYFCSCISLSRLSGKSKKLKLKFWWKFNLKNCLTFASQLEFLNAHKFVPVIQKFRFLTNFRAVAQSSQIWVTEVQKLAIIWNQTKLRSFFLWFNISRTSSFQLFRLEFHSAWYEKSMLKHVLLSTCKWGFQKKMVFAWDWTRFISSGWFFFLPMPT
jgi:hypothetical protein